MKFSSYLEAGLDDILGIGVSNFEAARSMHSFLTERQALEASFAAQLRDLNSKYECQIPTNTRTLWTAFQAIIEESRQLAESRSKLADDMNTNVCVALDSFLNDLEERGHVVEEEGISGLNKWKESEQRAHQAKVAYLKSCAEAESPAKRKKETDPQALKADYLSALAMSWDERHTLYASLLPDCVDKWQMLEESLSARFKECLLPYFKMMQSAITEYQPSTETLAIGVETIEPSIDSYAFVNWCPPSLPQPELNAIDWINPNCLDRPNFVEESARNAAQLFRIQHELDLYDIDLADGKRRFVMQGELAKISPVNGTRQERIFILCNDILLYGSKPTMFKRQFELKGCLYLKRVLLRDLTKSEKWRSRLGMGMGKIDEAKGFQLVDAVKKKVMTIFAPTEVGKREWVEALHSCIEEQMAKMENEAMEQNRRAQERATKIGKQMEEEFAGQARMSSSQAPATIDDLRSQRAEQKAQVQRELAQVRAERAKAHQEASRRAAEAMARAANEKEVQVAQLHEQVAKLQQSLAEAESALWTEQDKVGRLLARKLKSKNDDDGESGDDLALCVPDAPAANRITPHLPSRGSLMAAIRQGSELRTWAGKEGRKTGGGRARRKTWTRVDLHEEDNSVTSLFHGARILRSRRAALSDEQEEEEEEWSDQD